MSEHPQQEPHLNDGYDLNEIHNTNAQHQDIHDRSYYDDESVRQYQGHHGAHQQDMGFYDDMSVTTLLKCGW